MYIHNVSDGCTAMQCVQLDCQDLLACCVCGSVFQ